MKFRVTGFYTRRTNFGRIVEADDVYDARAIVGLEIEMSDPTVDNLVIEAVVEVLDAER